MGPDPLLVLTCLQWENCPSQKQDLKEKTVSRVLRQTQVGNQEVRTEKYHQSLDTCHLHFQLILFAVLEPRESLTMLKKLTM
jgi:hypothetical protein